MTDELAARIEELRKAAARSSDDPGFIAPPYKGATLPLRIPPAYQDFLWKADGAVCGVVHLFDSADVLSHQREADVLLRTHRWFCFGRVEDDLLILDTVEGTVSRIAPEDHVSPEEAMGEFEYFLLNYVFGQDYAEFVPHPQDDPWYQLL
jgi:hypothetical protein